MPMSACATTRHHTQDRAQDARKRAFVVVPGYGLGVWRFDKGQPAWFVERAGQLLKELSLPNISDVIFPQHGGVTTCGGAEHGLQAILSHVNAVRWFHPQFLGE